MRVREMLSSHPEAAGVVNDALVQCIEACFDCAQICISCADACLAEDQLLAALALHPPRSRLRRCLRQHRVGADPADRRDLGPDGADAGNLRRLRRLCADECDRHAGHHEHCRICAETCRQCERACHQAATASGQGGWLTPSDWPVGIPATAGLGSGLNRIGEDEIIPARADARSARSRALRAGLAGVPRQQAHQRRVGDPALGTSASAPRNGASWPCSGSSRGSPPDASAR